MLKTRLTCLSLAGLVLGFATAASAVTTSDRAAGVLVWPKVLVDTAGTITGDPTDTVITLSNTNTGLLKMAHCFYVNATGHCANDPDTACFSADDCTASACDPGWSKIDFNIFLTRDQPLGWLASEGLGRGDLPIEGPLGRCSRLGPNDPSPVQQCISNAQCPFPRVCEIGPDGQNNIGTGIPPVPDDPFIGSLTCIQFDPGAPGQPAPDHTSSRNSLIGEADIVNVSDPNDAGGAKYNAVGFRSNTAGDTNDILTFGPDPATSDYEGCAQTLVFDHFFDGALDPIAVQTALADSTNGEITTELTLVPCGNNLLTNTPGVVVAQFLVFNEFEQRFSASRTVDCFLDTPISNIDTPNNARSIFSAGVAGTLVGQTRIQGVGSSPSGHGLTGIARQLVETPTGVSGSSYNLDQNGMSGSVDTLTIP